ncbi:MAG: Two-component system response regulator OmpR [Myxococcaceae bacterium]|nr:Two-component system response regulator OmpR [Myxococcaceae bacterium]
MEVSVQELPKKALIDRLLAERKINREQAQAVIEHALTSETRLEDALIETGTMDEPSLLAWLAAVYQTRFVSTEKLARAEIDRTALGLVPRELAERAAVFPVVFDASTKTLAFVTADPDQLEIAREVRMVTRVPNVRPYLARPAAVRAAINKHYNGDIHAFSKVEQRNVKKTEAMFRGYGHNMFDEETIASRSATGLRSTLTALPDPQTGSRPLPDPPSYERPLEDLRQSRPGLGVPPPVPPAASTREFPAPARMTPISLGGQESSVTFASSIEVQNVLVSLLENQRQELRGHSAQVSRFMQKLGDHMQLSRADVYALRLCGLLHDVGKTSSYHLTALNVAEYEGHRTEAQKCFMGPVRLFDGANLPKSCIEGFSALYERFDGQGFPDRRAGKDIPLSARMLAVAESYADLTANPRNPFRRVLTAKSAIEVIARYKEKVFDGDLVDLFRIAVIGDDMQSRLLNDRGRILLVDADADETTVLELRLVEQGHEVILCRTAEQAFQRFQQGGIDAVICEVDLEPHDGFTLVEHMRKQRGGAEVPVLFLTRRTERAAVDRGFSLGAVDYISKPAAPDVVVAKVRSVLGKAKGRGAARGVSGALAEMPLPDVIQVLSRTRKSGRLVVSTGGYNGEIQLGNGAIYNAKFMNLSGQDALFALLALTEGEFALDPSVPPGPRVIHEGTEQLLLEGMRRIDEEGGQLEELVEEPVEEPIQEMDFAATRIDEQDVEQ